jgi:hypothetical protein
MLVLTDNFLMAIERLSLPEGILINTTGYIQLFIGHLLFKYADRLTLLDPGYYDLTPAIWKSNKNNYSLVVHPNGEATSMSKPINPGAKMVKMHGHLAGTESIQHSRSDHINAQNPVLVIAGGRNNDKGAFLYEAIFYLP